MNCPSESNEAQEVLMTSAEVAKVLKVSLYTLRAMTREGRIPCIRFSQKTIRYRSSDIQAIARGEIKEAAQ